MRIIKNVLWLFINLFFRVYFYIFGKPKISRALQKTLILYGGSNFFELFSLIRAWDAPFYEVNKAVPLKGLIVDLGCGDGTQSNFLALSSKERKVVGVEINKDRILEADKGIKNTKFLTGDIRSVKFPKADCIVLTHVLHHLPNKLDQQKLLKRLHGDLKKSGKLVIVEIIEKPFLKYVFTWLTDAFTVPILFEKKLYDFNFHYRKEREWIELCRRLGFVCTVTYPHKGKPFSHVLFECKKSTQ